MGSNHRRMRSQFSITVILTSIAMLTACSSPRPTASELALSQYDSLCNEPRKYNTNCKGRFIIWDGSITSIESEYTRVKFTDDLTMDVQGLNAKELGLVDSQRVRVSGWLADKNFTYPDISDGEITGNESASIAQNRAATEAAQQRREAAAYHRRMDEELTYCKLLDPELGQGDQAGIRECLEYRMR